MLAQAIAKPIRTGHDVQSQVVIARIAAPTIPSAGTDPSIETSPPKVELAAAAELAEDRILLSPLAAEDVADETIDERLEEILEAAPGF